MPRQLNDLFNVLGVSDFGKSLGNALLLSALRLLLGVDLRSLVSTLDFLRHFDFSLKSIISGTNSPELIQNLTNQI